MNRRRKIALLAVLAAIFAGLQLRGLIDGGSRGAPSILQGRKTERAAPGPSAAERLAGVLRLSGEAPPVGVRDIFRRAPDGMRAVAARRPDKPEAATAKPPAPAPPPAAPPPPPPPAAPPALPPPEDPMVQVRKDLAAYRFVGYFRKTAGDQVLFLMKGTDVFLVKKGDILVRGVVVAEVKEREIILQVGADRKARAALRDNSPLSIF
jgi:hypothetical protein